MRPALLLHFVNVTQYEFFELLTVGWNCRRRMNRWALLLVKERSQRSVLPSIFGIVTEEIFLFFWTTSFSAQIFRLFFDLHLCFFISFITSFVCFIKFSHLFCDLCALTTFSRGTRSRWGSLLIVLVLRPIDRRTQECKRYWNFHRWSTYVLNLLRNK